MTRGVLVFLASAVVLSAGPAMAAKDSLTANLRRLQQRVKASQPKLTTKPAPKPAPAAAPAARPRRVSRQGPVRLARSTPPRTATHPVRSTRPLKTDYSTEYLSSRIGARAKTGDIQVSAAGGGQIVHVYFGQRLVSSGGNGMARVPDVRPGKYPVMVWSPGRGPRRTFWISVKPNVLTSLSVNL